MPSKSPRRPKHAQPALLAVQRRLQADVIQLTSRIDQLERQYDSSVRRCGELQADLDALKKLIAPV